MRPLFFHARFAVLGVRDFVVLDGLVRGWMLVGGWSRCRDHGFLREMCKGMEEGGRV